MSTSQQNNRPLHHTASSRLPDWPKEPNGFYVAILPHHISVAKCNKDNFLWLKAGTIRSIHSERVEIGTDTILVDGMEIVMDDAQMQNFDHFKSGTVVLWANEDN